MVNIYSARILPFALAPRAVENNSKTYKRKQSFVNAAIVSRTIMLLTLV